MINVSFDLTDLVKFIREYDSNTFNGTNLTEADAIKIAVRLIRYHIDYLKDDGVDGVVLSEIYDDVFNPEN